MQRQIKFRGKRIDNNQWVYGYLSFIYVSDIGEKARIYDPINVLSHDVYTATVGQFTGKLDPKGVEIFEGDIMEGTLRNEFGSINPGLQRSLIDYEKGCTAFVSRIGTEWYYIGKFLEVIGNVTDNPDLIK